MPPSAERPIIAVLCERASTPPDTADTAEPAAEVTTLDVFDREPLPPDHPLWDAPNVTITAHMSGDVIGWRDTLSAQFVANVRRWLAGEPLLNVVDKKLGYVPTGDR
jgi:D-isomer specific 2-hydroxyacid dehydrogenase, NAD binding domain